MGSHVLPIRHKAVPTDGCYQKSITNLQAPVAVVYFLRNGIGRRRDTNTGTVCVEVLKQHFSSEQNVFVLVGDGCGAAHQLIVPADTPAGTHDE
jgi:hypothetical protein